jgi:hypothetical protein
MDEMALLGVLSIQLLHERMIQNPTLAAAPKATRTVVGDSLAGIPMCPGVS